MRSDIQILLVMVAASAWLTSYLLNLFQSATYLSDGKTAQIMGVHRSTACSTVADALQG